MKTPNRVALALSVFTLLFACSVQAQQKEDNNSRRTEMLAARTEATQLRGEVQSRASMETLRDEASTLSRRKSALQRYLLSVSPESADYSVTQTAIKDIEAKIKKVEQELQAGLSSDSYASILADKNLTIASESALNSRIRPFNPGLGKNAHGGIRSTDQSSTDASSLATKSLNDFLAEKIQAKVDQTSTTKQTETPSTSENSTSLVDQSSASDLIGVAMNLSGLSAKSNDKDKKDADSTSVTASAYSLYAAFQGVNPMNTVFYNQNRGWRRVFFTLGYDNEKAEGTETTDKAKIFGAKLLLWDRRDPGLYHDKFRDVIGKDLMAANSRFSQTYHRVLGYLFHENEKTVNLIKQEFAAYLQDKLSKATTKEDTDRIQAVIHKNNAGEAFKFGPNNRLVQDETVTSLEEQEYYRDFQNKYLAGSAGGFDQSILADLDQFIDRELANGVDEFAKLDADARELIKSIRKAPQFSASFLTKQRQKGIDEYTGELIFDYGLADRVTLTLNGDFNYGNSKVIGGDTRGGTFAGQLKFRFNKQPESLFGKKPVYFAVATNNKWGAGMKPTYMLQGKLMIPIADGFDIPLSLTFANRTNLIKEKVIRGQFGFTFDTARLFRAFLSK